MTTAGVKDRLFDIGKSIIYSYSQVFFSTNKVFAGILILVSFFDIYAGLSGLLAIIISNSFALLLGMKRQNIVNGSYGFNPLMVGLGIGIYYQPGVEYFLLLIVVSLLTLLITLSLEGILNKYGLPFLSIPFLFGIWFVLIASRGYSALELSERGVYSLNDMFAIGGMTMVEIYQWFNNLPIPEAFRIYFKSLSAILFQYHLFAGLLLAAGLLIYSRISFLMSIIGFMSAYYFYMIIGANISELSYSYIGFNYILMSIAIGGYFIVPSRNTVLWVVMLTPVVAITLSSTSALFANFGISVYSLPFNAVVLLFLYTLKLRETNLDKIVPVVNQLHSPELNAYASFNYKRRFGSLPVFSMKLPFWGKWKITQAHRGDITHKDLWKFAWDFEVCDNQGKTFRNTGDFIEDYYCYNKPVLAPADGRVVAVENNVPENKVGEVNISRNWGNSVVIEHGPYFYSQLSHLKFESIKVTQGQYVKQGEILGVVGNSGRSPVPHLHMQFQAGPEIGSPTIDYPFSSLITDSDKGPVFEAVNRPVKNQIVSNIDIDEAVANAFSFVPGTELEFETSSDKGMETTKWIAESDIYNNKYLRCTNSDDKAWYNSIGDIYYFTYYEGSRNSLLYHFYLAAFKLAMTFDRNLVISDRYPLNVFPGKLLITLQDFLIPFIKILRTDFILNYKDQSNYIGGTKIVLNSKSRFGISGKTLESSDYEIVIDHNGILSFTVDGPCKIEAKRIN